MLIIIAIEDGIIVQKNGSDPEKDAAHRAKIKVNPIRSNGAKYGNIAHTHGVTSSIGQNAD